MTLSYQLMDIMLCVFALSILLGAHVDTCQTEHIEIQSCDAYEMTKLLNQLHNRRPALEDNPAYGVHQGTQ